MAYPPASEAPGKRIMRRRRRTAADREPERDPAVLQSRMTALRVAVLSALVLVVQWRRTWDLKSLHKLRTALREADVQVEMLIDTTKRLNKA
jgi:hypothetical protein